jgi:hypothetical protein
LQSFLPQEQRQALQVVFAARTTARIPCESFSLREQLQEFLANRFCRENNKESNPCKNSLLEIDVISITQQLKIGYKALGT